MNVALPKWWKPTAVILLAFGIAMTSGCATQQPLPVVTPRCPPPPQPPAELMKAPGTESLLDSFDRYEAAKKTGKD